MCHTFAFPVSSIWNNFTDNDLDTSTKMIDVEIVADIDKNCTILVFEEHVLKIDDIASSLILTTNEKNRNKKDMISDQLRQNFSNTFLIFIFKYHIISAFKVTT